MSMSLLTLVIENIGPLSHANINLPSSGLVPVSGDNGSGKSTLLKAISYLFEGVSKKDAVEIVKTGTKQGSIKAYICIYDLYKDGFHLETNPMAAIAGGKLKYIMERIITPEGSRTITVTTPEGASYPSPQKMATAFLKDLTLDPSEFSGMEEKEQYELLMKLVPISYDPAIIEKLTGPIILTGDALRDISQARAGLYEHRKNIGRSRDREKILADQIVIPPDKEGTVEVDLQSVLEKQQALWKEKEEQAAQKELLLAKNKNFLIANQKLNDHLNEVESLNSQLLKLTEKIEGLKNNYSILKDARIQAEDLLQIQENLVKSLPDLTPGFADIEKTITEIRETNNWASVCKNKVARLQAVSILEDEYKNFTAKIEELDNYKSQLLTGVKFPLPGLSVDEESQKVVLNGRPLKSLGEFEQTLVGCSIAKALKPTLNLIVCPHDILIDPLNKVRWQAWAEENGFTILYADILNEDDPGVKFFIRVKDGKGEGVNIPDEQPKKSIQIKEAMSFDPR